MTETEHAQWIKQFWKDKLDEIKGVDRMSNEYLDIAMEKVTKQEINKVLDKMRDEIERASHGKCYVGRIDGKSEEVLLLDEVLEIIDKYREG